MTYFLSLAFWVCLIIDDSRSEVDVGTILRLSITKHIWLIQGGAVEA